MSVQISSTDDQQLRVCRHCFNTLFQHHTGRKRSVLPIKPGARAMTQFPDDLDDTQAGAISFHMDRARRERSAAMRGFIARLFRKKPNAVRWG
jgi:hypothetical protein